MELADELVCVRSLSDDALLLGLARSLRASRRAVAEVVAHLGEVEERRLHLLGGYSSMFDYCVRRLNMSEDEAYRRIEAARLVRQFPRLLQMLGAGQISLSVAVLLKARLTDANHRALLADVSGKTVAQAREVLAAWFPQPDVMPLLRKLPARSAPPVARVQDSLIGATQTAPLATSPEAAPATAPNVADAAPAAPSLSTHPTAPEQSSVSRPGRAPAAVNAPRSLEPLSPDRYKLQLTVTTDLKRKLDLARDLLRHAIPSGDLATIIERALDLLLQQTLKRRFAAKRSGPPNASRKNPPESAHAAQPSVPTPAPVAPAPPAIAPVDSCTAPAPPPAMPLVRSLSVHEPDIPTAAAAPPPAAASPMPSPAAAVPAAFTPIAHCPMSSSAAASPGTFMPVAPSLVEPSPGAFMPVAPALVEPSPGAFMPVAPAPAASSAAASSAAVPSPLAFTLSSKAPAAAMPSIASRHIPNEARRAVAERDGLRCTWQAPDGTRCNSRAWLEHDHIIPRGKGGTHDPANGRILCQSHNRLSAERAYGQDTITGIIAHRRSCRPSRPCAPQPERKTEPKAPPSQ